MTPASTPYTFHQLVADLSSTLGSSGLDSKDVDLEKLTSLMEKYVSREGDWEKYAFKNTSMGYTRNLVDEGNGKSNLLVLVWTPGKGSPIHDHANAHCLMKILKGTLHETHYAYPSKTGSAPTMTKDFVHRENAVAYMSDELGVHRISNQDPKEFAVSLHLYTPPNARHEGCHTFNEKTGEKSHIKQFTFFTEFGHKVMEATKL